jgi:hypothetical protein
LDHAARYLPVEQPIKFALRLPMTSEQALSVRADEVIE